jgi:hypothetical protein
MILYHSKSRGIRAFTSQIYRQYDDKQEFIEITQKLSQTLIPLCPLRPLRFVSS